MNKFKYIAACIAKFVWNKLLLLVAMVDLIIAYFTNDATYVVLAFATMFIDGAWNLSDMLDELKEINSKFYETNRNIEFIEGRVRNMEQMNINKM